jgi:hypothetical protein
MPRLTFISCTFNIDHTVTITTRRGQNRDFVAHRLPFNEHTRRLLLQLDRAICRQLAWYLTGSGDGWAAVRA